MLVALPIVSFFCVVILGVFAAGPRIRTDVAQLALVLWLLVCNLIQGINSLVWAGNTDIHVPRWCDLVTKVLLGLVVAIPGACICISTRLARIHDDQKKKPSSKRLQYILDGLFCFVIPVLYMCLHFIVQDHRFNILENFGCSASVYPANQAIVLMLLPPMLLGGVAFFSTSQSSFSNLECSFDAHTSASTMSSFPDFSRRASTVMILGSATTIITLFGNFIRSNIIPWVSLAAVHRDFTVIAIVKSDVDIVPIEFAWWSVSSISWLYIGLSIVLGEDIRDAVRSSPKVYASITKWLKAFEPRLPRLHISSRPLLPLHIRRRAADPSSTISPTPRSPTSTASMRSGTSPVNYPSLYDPSCHPRIRFELLRRQKISFPWTSVTSYSPTTCLQASTEKRWR
uniref:Pheromone receptor n=1 Tax=Lentinula edodes TaxID=5353 RepID=T1RLD1_LENED|nr:pheromone receptor [Lentinula edodes]